jgi:hypothetical protein
MKEIESEENEEQNDDEEENNDKKIKENPENIKVLGYNSKKFDINLFCTQIAEQKISIVNISSM